MTLALHWVPEGEAMTSRFQQIDHIDLCADDTATYRSHDGLFSQFQFVHNALPQIAMDDVDLRTPFLDSTLKAPDGDWDDGWAGEGRRH